jgi:predicted MFS family arabinose efflux permease
MRSLRFDGLAIRVIASLIPTAGVFYIVAMPVLVDALKVASGLTTREAGLISAANMYGGAFGSAVLALYSRRAHWDKLANWLLPALIIADALSAWVHSAAVLAVLRFAQGCLGGALVGAGYLLISRIPIPSRTFAMSILAQVLLGAGMVSTFPLLVRDHGIGVVYGTMCLFSALTWALLQRLPTVVCANANPTPTGTPKVPSGRIVISLVTVALFQAGNMAIYANEVGLGQSLGHSVSFISSSLGLCGFVELLGPLAVVLLPTTAGFRWPVLAALLAALLGVALLFLARTPGVWLTAIILWRLGWSCGLPMLFGLCALLDSTGRAPAWVAFTSKLGLATGPLLAAFALGADRFAALTGVAIVLLAVAMLAAIAMAQMAGQQREVGLSRPVPTVD